MVTRQGPDAAAREAMNYLVSTSKRTKGVQLPRSFLRDDSPDPHPPIARLVQGGRGGEVRLKLYLTAVLIAGGAPYVYEKTTPARVWAALLNLPDPETAGARRISDAFAWLHRHRYLDVDRARGRTTSFRLLDSNLTGEDYEKPSRDYVSVPLGLWKQHWMSAMSGRDLAILLAILDTPGDDTDSSFPRFLTTEQRNRYGLSPDTWTRAVRQLHHIRAIEVDNKVSGRYFQFRRVRNVYRVLDPEFSTEPIWPVTQAPVSGFDL
ncbi:hypothetical protein RBB84_22500 [Rhodococcus sp. D-6]|uniref:Uncharacterized protein n=2 Tax=unclassified Rhodococcus (in: high G+C Gram-positive bacteria) TaxID=192944 RepID=A0AAU7UXX5_9NOCA